MRDTHFSFVLLACALCFCLDAAAQTADPSESPPPLMGSTPDEDFAAPAKEKQSEQDTQPQSRPNKESQKRPRAKTNVRAPKVKKKRGHTSRSRNDYDDGYRDGSEFLTYSWAWGLAGCLGGGFFFMPGAIIAVVAAAIWPTLMKPSGLRDESEEYRHGYNDAKDQVLRTNLYWSVGGGAAGLVAAGCAYVGIATAPILLPLLFLSGTFGLSACVSGTGGRAAPGIPPNGMAPPPYSLPSSSEMSMQTY